GAVDFRGVEEGDAPFDRGAKHRNHLLLLAGRAVAETHAHAAEADGGDFEILSEFSFLHGLNLPRLAAAVAGSLAQPVAKLLKPLNPLQEVRRGACRG